MVDIFFPFEWIASLLTYSLFGLDEGTHLALSVHFIFYDLMKIFFLLAFMIFVVSYLRTYVNAQKVRDKLGGKKGIFYHGIASLVGVISPFCSCSSIPLFIGFVEAGVPLGITFSFLITSPLVNEAAIALLWALFGFKVMILYVVSGVVIGIVGGMIIGKLKMESHVEDFVYKIKSKGSLVSESYNFKKRCRFAYLEVVSIVKRVWVYIIIGVGIGGFSHGYLPEQLVTSYLSKDNIFAVPLAILLGVPLYINVLGAIPIVESLIMKGLPIGTALAFLMAITAISFPEMVILKKVLKMRLIVVFVSIVTVSIMITGFIFNLIL